MNLQNIMLSEISQSQKDKYNSTHRDYLRVKFIETESRMAVARGWGEGENGELVLNVCRVSV